MVRKVRSSEGQAEAALIEAIRKGNQAACTALVFMYSPIVRFFLSPKIRDDEDVKDVMQEVWIVVFRFLSRYPDVKIRWFKSWLLRIAARRVLDYYRKKYADTRMKTAVKEEMRAEKRSRRLRPVRRQDLEKAISHLPRRARLIVSLHLLKKIPFEEIARMLNLTMGAVSGQYYKALSRLRKDLLSAG